MDRSLEGESSADIPIIDNTLPVILGNRATADRGWKGGMDDIRLYDEALTYEQLMEVRDPGGSANHEALGLIRGIAGLVAAVIVVVAFVAIIRRGVDDGV